MERKVGERFDFKGETLEVIERIGCKGCYFFNRRCTRITHSFSDCNLSRSDSKSVIFKRVDKSLDLLTKAHEELVRCGIESEIVDEIEEYLNKTK